MIKKLRYIYVCLIAVLACCVSTSVRAQSVFAHYKGVNNLPYIRNPYGIEMQQVHEYEYTYYVTKGMTIELPLPFEGYNGSANRSDEPKGYIRWYDYNTDMSAANLSAYGTSSLLTPVVDAEGNNRGLFSWKTSTATEPNGPNHTTIGVNYKAPAEADELTWKGEDIACDVSRYIDFGAVNPEGTTDQYFTHEPTLQIRYIFHIRPAKAMAENIINTTSVDIRGKYEDITIEDNRQIVFGAKDANAKMSVRVIYKPSNYFFYPLKPSDGKQRHLLSTDGVYCIKEADYDKSKLYNANGFVWYAYDETKTKYTVLISRGATQMHSFTDMHTLMTNGNGWKNLDGSGTTPPNITFGSTVYLVAYAYYYETDIADNSIKAPIASFEILYQNTYPKTQAQIDADGDSERNLDYFEKHYLQATKPISFDDDNPTLTVEAPNEGNRISKFASRWNRRSYSYAYPQLKSQSCPNVTWDMIHGEYVICKSKDVAAVVNGKAEGSKVLYDRTYAMTEGKQYGYFLHFDASDESRKIAVIDFKANLCSGSKLIFSAAVADLTAGPSYVAPQVLFKLYGIIKDANDKVIYSRLITSFSSGDLANNTQGAQRQFGVWYQMYSRLVLPRNSGVENFSDFRIEVHNMCSGTNGADYAVDDLRLYIQRSKIEVAQNEPVCPNQLKSASVPDKITLKISTHYENAKAFTSEVANPKIFYRLCDIAGNPLTNIDYNGDGNPDEYGTSEVPETYDETKMLPSYAAGGATNKPMFEKDPEKHIVLLLANRHFDLVLGQKYYVSVAYPDENNPSKPGVWGKSINACSTYSDDFEIVQQKFMISDLNGNVVTTVRVSCDANRTPDVKIIGKLETADVVNGGSITLNTVKFDWFLSEPNKENDFASIHDLQEALIDYRDHYREVKGLDAGYQTVNPDRYNLLKTYIDNHRLILSASNNLDDHQFLSGWMGTYKIAAVPIGTEHKEGTITYLICPEPLYFTLRVVEDGPKLTLGFGNVVYPNDERAVRIGLPQIMAMLAKNKELILPVASLESTTQIEFLNDVFISDSNDPTFDNTKQIVGKIKNTIFDKRETKLRVVFNSKALTVFREGYWYELNFSYQQHRVGSETVVSCPGEMFIKFKIVPEYLTWNSTPDNKFNANWNNDLNWMRSTAAEIYKTDYTDYGQQAYTPMKFSKVTIANQTGRVYPSLGNIVYREGNDIATKLTNDKGEEPTPYIAYDMMVKWNYDTDDHSDTGDGVFSCETFHGNLCSEIYFKPQAELLNQTYLVYKKAYAELEVAKNRWHILSSPLKATYAGDFYAPKSNGRQVTEAFKPISFDNKLNSRTDAPVYQRNWDGDGTEVVDGIHHYEANDYKDGASRIDTISDGSMDVASLYWSHTYNKVNEEYANGKGFALKSGDDYTNALATTSLFRLPKEDSEYSYYNADGTENSSMKISVDRTDNYQLIVEPSTAEEALGKILQPLTGNTHSNNRYYIVGNPYTASLSMYRFLNGNPSFERKVWTLDNGVLNAHSVPEGTYNRSQDYIIEPMQGFFVKVKEGETVSQAKFTLTMTTDRWISGGVAVQEPAAVYINVVNDDNLCSTAKVVVCNDADDEFVDDEDVELLNNSDIEDVPQVYTVAGNQAAALNKLSNINFLPLGIIAKEDGKVMSNGATVNVEISANRYVTDKLFVFDAKMGTFTPADAPISIRANEHGRYYITTSTYNLKQHNDEANIKCFSPNSGTITVSSPNIAIANVRIYNAEGLLVTSALGINQASWTKNIGCGLFIVKAETMDGQSKTFKLSVR